MHGVILDEKPLTPLQLKRVLLALEDPSEKVQNIAIDNLCNSSASADLKKVQQKYIDVIEQKLTSTIPYIQIRAACAYTRMGIVSNKAVLAMVRLLVKDDPYTNYSKKAANELTKMGNAGAKVAPKMVKALRYTSMFNIPQPNVHILAAEVLSNIDKERFKTKLAMVKLLKDSNPEIQLSAANILIKMDVELEKTELSMVKLLQYSNPYIQISAAKVLMNMGRGKNKTALAMIKLLSFFVYSLRHQAADILSDMDGLSKKAIQELVKLLTHRDEYIQIIAANLLSKGGDVGTVAVQELLKLLTHPELSVQTQAAETLILIGKESQKAVSALVKILSSPNFDGPISAAKVISTQKGKNNIATSALVKLLNNPEPIVQIEAAKALIEMGDEHQIVKITMTKLLNDSRSEDQIDAARILVEMNEESIRIILAMLRLIANSNRPLYRSPYDMPNDGLPQQAYDVLNTIDDTNSKAVSLIYKFNHSIQYQQTQENEVLSKLGKLDIEVVPELVKLLIHSNPFVQILAADLLIKMDEEIIKSAQALIKLFSHDHFDVPVVAANILSEMGEAGTKVVPELVKTLLFENSVSRIAARALIPLLATSKKIIPSKLFNLCLEAMLVNRSESSEIRFTCYLLGEMTEDQKKIILWVGNQEFGQFHTLEHVDLDATREILEVFNRLFPTFIAKEDEKLMSPRLLKEIASQIRLLSTTNKTQFNADDMLLLTNLIASLDIDETAGDASMLREVRDSIWFTAWIQRFGWFIFFHLLVWGLLIWVYPYFPLMQGVFFWNKWGRRFLGLGYVGVLITLVPYLRNRMFLPFRDSLLQRRTISAYDNESYFSDGVAVEKGVRVTGGKKISVNTLLSSVKGQLVLEGESGVGKTTQLLWLVKNSTQISILLRATECSKGIVFAIQARLQGQIRDEDYIRILIHAGSIIILIDGLNEATPDTRIRIVSDIEENFNGKFIITTQPMDWEPPRTAQIFVLQPLRQNQIEMFLRSQWPLIKKKTNKTKQEYDEVVQQYIQAVVSNVDGGIAMRILSNPMELTIVADLLALGEYPDLHQLVAQRFLVMDKCFIEKENRPFPYLRFAEKIYLWRISGDPYFDNIGLDAEIAEMVYHKLMIERVMSVKESDKKINKRRWWFRHEKFMEYSVLPLFLDEHTKYRQEHIEDEFFFGVYELLALTLSDEEEKKLWLFLIQHAADTKRNVLLNRYTIARRGRRNIRPKNFNGNI